MTAKIDQALLDHFIDGAYGLPIAHENLDYEPATGTAYCEVKAFINDVTPFSLAHNDETDGFFQCILRYPSGIGAVAAKTKADEVLSGFKIGTRLTYDGQRVTVNRVSRSQGANEEGWYKLTLRIYFAAILPR